MAKKGGLFGKIMDQVTPDEDKKDTKRDGGKEEHGGLLGKAFDKIKDRFDGDDDQKAESPKANTQPDSWRDQSQTAGGGSSYQSGTGAVAGGAVDHGKTSGSGMGREYVTRDGDTLEAIGAYFYGDPVHAQRLIDDNPQLQGHSGPLAAGMRLKVSEDASRGDAVKNAGY